MVSSVSAPDDDCRRMIAIMRGDNLLTDQPALAGNSALLYIRLDCLPAGHFFLAGDCWGNLAGIDGFGSFGRRLGVFLLPTVS